MSLNRYIEEVEKVLADLRSGEFGELAQLPKLKREMMSVSKQLREAEIELDQQIRAEEGRLAEGEIDFDAVRRSIGGRLDRLRAAGSTTDVSGESD
ncbi:hypothetical protein [Shimia ponticola]|uniref:hypothetical protein n=1 Tax=Shimia ponticola TaxID=2582893 RepID=UPI00164B6225|nr:hypothetical protein [Shimia ponticola]